LLFTAVYLSACWQFRRSFQVRLLAMLHIAFLGLTVLQQHSAKEEQVLYPWADRVLAEERDELLRRMQALT
jgi:hemerythrin-like domain-containing protein